MSDDYAMDLCRQREQERIDDYTDISISEERILDTKIKKLENKIKFLEEELNNKDIKYKEIWKNLQKSYKNNVKLQEKIDEIYKFIMFNIPFKHLATDKVTLNFDNETEYQKGWNDCLREVSNLFNDLKFGRKKIIED